MRYLLFAICFSLFVRPASSEDLTEKQSEWVATAIQQCLDEFSREGLGSPFLQISGPAQGMAPLAALANWYTSANYLHWIELNSGISWEFNTLVPDYFKCRKLDRWGNTVAELRYAGRSKTWSYWKDSSTEGRSSITLYIKEERPAPRDIEYRPAYALYNDAGAERLFRRNISGLNAGDEYVVGVIESRSPDGSLVMVMDDENLLHIDAHGRLGIIDNWPCGKSDPCTDAPDRTVLEFDENRNLLGRSYTNGGKHYEESFELDVNARGDWVTRRSKDGRILDTRQLIYFDSAGD